MRRLASACLVLAACDPVWLVGDRERLDASTAPGFDASAVPDAESPSVTAGASAPDAPVPRVQLSVTASDCGRCFELVASGVGGLAPYTFEWDDGSLAAQRRVCTEDAAVDVSVSARDANAARSTPAVTRLERAAQDAGCSASAPSTAQLCLVNPSFEGRPAVNFGLPEGFDAAPWNACTQAGAPASATANTPDIGDEASGQAITPAPKATDGSTFLALGEGEQASQKLCADVHGDTELKLAFDLARVNVNQGTAPASEVVSLEIWGGTSADCSQRQLLWASPNLTSGWTRYCVELAPVEFMDQITLRTHSDMTQLTLTYLLVDHLEPVDDCP